VGASKGERRSSAKTRQWPQSVELPGKGRQQSIAGGGVSPRLGADAIDTFRASRRVGRAMRAAAGLRWRAAYVSTFRGDAGRGAFYVLTFRGDVAAAPWRAAALSGRGGDISPAGGGTLGEARWRSRRGYPVALAPQPRKRRCVSALLDFVSQAATSARCRPSALDNPHLGVVCWGNEVESSRRRFRSG
jgi:hypothetical protein